MGKKVLFIVSILISFAVSTVKADHTFTLVIDAGHGGRDAGAVGAFSKEKDINLKMALAFGRYVERNCPDVKVVYTRKTDVFLALNERANIANRNKADLFVSIHTNALPKGKIARGFEVYSLGMHRASDNLDVAKRENSVILIEKDYKQRYEGFDPNSSESYIMFEFIQDKNMAKSVELAKLIQKEVCASAGRPNKGVHQAGFLVLRATSMPSCLVELGFITTPDEERLLNSDSGVEDHARGIYQAFVKYKKKYNGSVTVPFVQKASQEGEVPLKELAMGMPQKQEREPRKMVEKVPQRIDGEEKQLEEKPFVPFQEKQDAAGNLEQGVFQAAVVPDDRDSISGSQRFLLSVNDKTDGDAIIFKVQIMATEKLVNTNGALFKGVENVDVYQDHGMYKYTLGASEDYNEIYRLRKSVLDKFPAAFIIALKNNERVDVRDAIRIFKENKKN